MIKFGTGGWRAIIADGFTKENIRLLVTTGRTAKIQGFVSPRTGRQFDAALRLEGPQAKFDFT